MTLDRGRALNGDAAYKESDDDSLNTPGASRPKRNGLLSRMFGGKKMTNSPHNSEPDNDNENSNGDMPAFSLNLNAKRSGQDKTKVAQVDFDGTYSDRTHGWRGRPVVAASAKAAVAKTKPKPKKKDLNEEEAEREFLRMIQTAPGSHAARTPRERDQRLLPNFTGRWQCVSTDGDWDSYLRFLGQSPLFRKLAKARNYGVDSAIQRIVMVNTDTFAIANYPTFVSAQPSFAEALKASHGETPSENKSNVVAKLNSINRRWDYSGDPELARIASMSMDGAVEAAPVVSNAKVSANGKGSPNKANGVAAVAAAPSPSASISVLAPVVTFAIDGSERLVPCNVLPSYGGSATKMVPISMNWEGTDLVTRHTITEGRGLPPNTSALCLTKRKMNQLGDMIVELQIGTFKASRTYQMVDQDGDLIRKGPSKMADGEADARLKKHQSAKATANLAKLGNTTAIDTAKKYSSFGLDDKNKSKDGEVGEDGDVDEPDATTPLTTKKA